MSVLDGLTLSSIWDIRVQVTLTLIIVTCYLIWRPRGKHYNLPPGPTPWPLIGNLIELRKDGLTYRLLGKMSKKYGDVFKIRIGTTTAVILNSADAIRDTLLKRQNDFAGRPTPYAIKINKLSNHAIVFGQFTPVWALQRKIAHGAIRKYANGQHLEELMHHSMDLVTKHLQSQTEAFYPREILSLLIYNIIAGMCFGKGFELNDPFVKNMIDMIEQFNEDFGRGTAADFVPFLEPLYNILPSQLRTNFEKFQKTFFKFLYEALEEHEKTYDPDNVTDFTYHVIHNMKKTLDDPEHKEAKSMMNKTHMVMILNDMFLAGTDTSRTVLIWAVQYIAAHPEVQRKMQKEIDDVVGAGRVLMAHKTQLPYCEAVLYEALRLRPVVPLAVPHKTLCDTKAGEYDIPKGTMVLANIWNLHHDPDQWEAPETFYPERFLDKNGQLAAKANSFLPFSTGRRVCLGESLAKAELHLLLAMLFQRFSVLPGPGEKLDCNIKEPSLSVGPHPYKVLFKER